MENFGWKHCREKFPAVKVISKRKIAIGLTFAVVMILASGLVLGMLIDKEIFGEVYKDIGREEAIKEFSDLLGKIPGGEKGETDRFMLIPSPDKEIIWDFQKGETAKI